MVMCITIRVPSTQQQRWGVQGWKIWRQVCQLRTCRRSEVLGGARHRVRLCACRRAVVCKQLQHAANICPEAMLLPQWAAACGSCSCHRSVVAEPAWWVLPLLVASPKT
jgi:hypothetical protein